jgi:preprotein translocase subunit SecD
MSRRFNILGPLGLFLVTMSLSCGWLDQSKVPRALAPSATVEVYEISPTETSNTRAETNPDTGERVYLLLPPIITADEVETVQRTDDITSLAFQLNSTGAKKLASATSPAREQRLAVVANNEILGVATVRSPLSKGFSISTGSIQKDREDIFEALTRE